MVDVFAGIQSLTEGRERGEREREGERERGERRERERLKSTCTVFRVGVAVYS